ncbi:hypothetical protein O0I10_005802 [Lichtheimia ornata]|uniref:G-patch domain-containing protein n=1 Tax=Lichtheimia ornata TaxID=688661 RepID=A0AAD7V343_9FUNG|nr:uncharacterized protein O0I10_005802 [Lichtheimia ornata]KAJ8658449.1 hypothetical protein O0I10_005802 [Lichtheimia ornata]
MEDVIDDEDEFSLPRNAEITGYIDYDKTHHVSMETHIPESNVGYRLLQKMGWREGQGLGSTGQGRVDPVRIDVKEDVIGIGKAQEEQAYHVSSTAKRKALGSEKQLEETAEERQQRESKAEKQQLIAEELKQVKRAFYCELCDKQYSKIAEYEQHLQSYDHHHKKRFKDMKESTRKSGFARSEQDKRRERERKREERELKRMHEAMLQRAGGGGAKSSTSHDTTTTTTTTRSNNTSSNSSGGWVTNVPQSSSGGGWVSANDNSGGKSGGWAAVNDQPTSTSDNSSRGGGGGSSSNSNSGGGGGGWNSVSESATTSTTTPSTPPRKFTLDAPKKKPAGFRFGFNKK